jgi:hypothetical protein
MWHGLCGVMDRSAIQGRLIALYQNWKSGFEPNGLQAEDFSPPLLLNVTENYSDASTKVVIYGQQTMGWDWTHCLQKSFPKYPRNWPYKDVKTFADFLANDDAVEALICGYEQFAFAKYQPITHRSPFWRAFREIQTSLTEGILWSNLVRMDSKETQFSKLPLTYRALFCDSKKRCCAMNCTRFSRTIAFFSPVQDTTAFLKRFFLN